MILSESSAEAGVLKNSVRPGDRSRMNITRVPRGGSRKLIRVPGAPRTSPSKQTRKKRRQVRHTWFWQAHDPKARADGANWDAALATLRARHEIGSRILPADRVSQIADQWRPQISAAARKHNVSEILLLGVVSVESRGIQRAKSPKGAQGLMQLIPATAARFGVTDAYDPAQNINGGAAYLAYLLKLFDEDPILALAGYNAGENAVKKHGGVPPYVETRDYVAQVFDAIATAERLCATKLAGPRTRCLWRPGKV